MAYDSFMDFFVITAFRKYNVDKSILFPKDHVHLIPTSDGKLEVFPIENIEVKRPLVEAEKFTLSLIEFSPKIPYIIGIIHLYRRIECYDSQWIIEILQDLENYLPVGCGVNLIHAMGKYAVFSAIKERNKSSEKY